MDILRLAFWVLFVGFLSGCNDSRPERVPVSGQVLIDGQPLAFGTVIVYPKDSRASSGVLDAEGRFELMAYKPGDGVSIGSHLVAVSAKEILSGDRVKWHAPKMYARPSTSGLSVEVSGPRDDVVIKLEWQHGQPFIERL